VVVGHALPDGRVVCVVDVAALRGRRAWACTVDRLGPDGRVLELAGDAGTAALPLPDAAEAPRPGPALDRDRTAALAELARLHPALLHRDLAAAASRASSIAVEDLADAHRTAMARRALRILAAARAPSGGGAAHVVVAWDPMHPPRFGPRGPSYHAVVSWDRRGLAAWVREGAAGHRRLALTPPADLTGGVPAGTRLAALLAGVPVPATRSPRCAFLDAAEDLGDGLVISLPVRSRRGIRAVRRSAGAAP
jgi:hypothetical protein